MPNLTTITATLAGSSGVGSTETGNVSQSVAIDTLQYLAGSIMMIATLATLRKRSLIFLASLLGLTLPFLEF